MNAVLVACFIGSGVKKVRGCVRWAKMCIGGINCVRGHEWGEFGRFISTSWSTQGHQWRSIQNLSYVPDDTTQSFVSLQGIGGVISARARCTM